jgi:hypothetical protein
LIELNFLFFCKTMRFKKNQYLLKSPQHFYSRTFSFLILLLIIHSAIPGAGQTPRLSVPEFFWALGHPVAALKVKQISKKCVRTFLSAEIKPHLDTYSDGGTLDAYRHVYYMAAFAQKINTRKLRRLGLAHEKSNYRQFRKHRLEDGSQPDSLASVMDLHNNELGLAIGCNFRHVPSEELKKLVLNAIKEGKAVILKRNQSGKFLDCYDRVIDPAQFYNSWYVPKCIVPSNYINEAAQR